ncbi:MAG: metallopeptidase TldD-related protein, partial [Dehalococcoidales bacterium]|nr:metallopeptidase TldD-related protein [Dehalococcoidales bacterium]
ATTTSLENARELVDSAVATAEFGTKAEFQFPSMQHYPEVAIFDPAVEKVSIEKMTQLGEELIARITAFSPEIMCEAGVTRATCTVNIINSRGGQANFRQSIFGIGIEGQLIRGTDMLFVGDHESSCHPVLKTDEIARTTLRQLELAKRLAKVTTKPMPVIFTPDGVGSSLVLPLMSAFNGKTVLEGASPIGNKLGETVFDKNLTMCDDPTVPYRTGSRPCDDEAVPCRRTPLITNGSVSNFLYDLQTAARANKKSTGNGHRQGGLPTPSPHAFVISPGGSSFDDMVKNIEEGLIVEQLLGAGQGNMLGGDFSGNILLGFKIEKGEIVGRVKDTMVSGNVYQLLKEIAAIGSDSKWAGGFLFTPSICCANVSVASR